MFPGFGGCRGVEMEKALAEGRRDGGGGSGREANALMSWRRRSYSLATSRLTNSTSLQRKVQRELAGVFIGPSCVVRGVEWPREIRRGALVDKVEERQKEGAG